MFVPESEKQSESAYTVVVVDGAIETTYRSGLSHTAAMELAEALQLDGKVVRVMHVTPAGRHEVDRYPPR